MISCCFKDNRAYRCKRNELDSSIRDKFVQLGIDAETREYLEQCIERNTFLNNLGSKLCKLFMSNTEAIAFMDFGRMFVISSQHLDNLLTASENEKVLQQIENGILIDVGSGNGDVTMILSNLVNGIDNVIAIESSQGMLKLLESKGISNLSCSLSDEILMNRIQSRNVACISLMNVLDRCSHPLSLLKDARKLLHPKGLVIIALVFPFCPFVENGQVQETLSTQLSLLGRKGRYPNYWEENVNVFTNTVLTPLGFRVQCISRVPYYSENDIWIQDYCSIDDAIFICSRDG